MKVRGCRDVEALLGAYADRELDPHEAAAVAAHLAACSACQAEYSALERGDRAVLALGEAELSPAELDDLAGRVRARLAPVEEGALARSWRERRPFAQILTWRRLVPVAAAAVVLLLVLRVNERPFRGRDNEPARGPVFYLVSPEATGVGRAPVASVPQDLEGSRPPAPAPAAKGGPALKLMLKGTTESAPDEADVTGAAPTAEPPAPTASLPAREEARPESQVAIEAAPPQSQVAVDVLQPSAAPTRRADAAASRGSRTEVPGLYPRQKTAAADYALATPGQLARGRDLLAHGQPAAAAVVLDSLLETLPPGDPSPGAREARAMRLAAAEAIAGSDPDRKSERELAALYEHLSGAESDPELAASWAARSIELTAVPVETGADARTDATDCRLLAARIRDFVARFPGDSRTDSLAAAGARLPCAP